MSPNDQTSKIAGRRKGGRRSGRNQAHATEIASAPTFITPIAGRLNPLSAADLE